MKRRTARGGATENLPAGSVDPCCERRFRSVNFCTTLAHAPDCSVGENWDQRERRERDEAAGGASEIERDLLASVTGIRDCDLLRATRRVKIARIKLINKKLLHAHLSVKRREETTTFQSKDLSFHATPRAKRTKKRGVWGFPPSRRRPSRDLWSAKIRSDASKSNLFNKTSIKSVGNRRKLGNK